MAGFNLGRFEHSGVTRGGYTVEVYANRGVEDALQPQKRELLVVPPQSGLAGRSPLDGRSVSLSRNGGPTTGARLEQFALEIAAGLEFMADYFGPPVLKNLTVSPIPGTFGQGFPGLVYLSTLAYLDPRYRPRRDADGDAAALLFTTSCPRTKPRTSGGATWSPRPRNEDDWMMEALANYSALLYLEKRKGPRAARPDCWPTTAPAC